MRGHSLKEDLSLSDEFASTMFDDKMAASAAQEVMLDEEPTVTQSCPLLKKPNAGTKITGNRIDIEFDPDKSETVKNCERIVHVQFVRTWADGNIIKRGDFDSAW